MTADDRTVDSGRVQRWDAWLGLRHEEALEPELPIVDPHHHLWDRGGHSYLAQQFVADAAGGHRLEATLYVECKSHYRESGPLPLRPVGETEFVAALSAPPIAGAQLALCAGIVAFADLSLGDAVDEVLDAHQAAGAGRFKGVRYATAWDADPAIRAAYSTGPGMLRQPSVHAGARRLAARALPLDLWLYFHQLDEVALLAKACPGLSIVVDHCGAPIGIGPYAARRDEVFQRWQTTIRALRPLPNVVLKFGGLAMALAGFGWNKLALPPDSESLASAWQPYFDTCLEVFGPARCMFESNFPVDRTGCSYTILWNAFKRLAVPLSDGERRALCAGTARHIYGL